MNRELRLAVLHTAIGCIATVILVAVMISLAGCSGVPMSRGAAMSVAAMLAEVGSTISTAMEDGRSARKGAAVDRLARECEVSQEGVSDCIAELHRDEMKALNQATTALDRTYDVLDLWEDVNRRASGRGGGPRLSDLVCDPLEASLHALLRALGAAGVELCDRWRQAIDSAGLVCRFGFSLFGVGESR